MPLGFSWTDTQYRAREFLSLSPTTALSLVPVCGLKNENYPLQFSLVTTEYYCITCIISDPKETLGIQNLVKGLCVPPTTANSPAFCPFCP